MTEYRLIEPGQKKPTSFHFQGYGFYLTTHRIRWFNNKRFGDKKLPIGTIVGEMHFLPNGYSDNNPQNLSHALYYGIQALSSLEAFFGQLREEGLENIIPQYLIGSTNPEMANFTRRLGFDVKIAYAFDFLKVFNLRRKKNTKIENEKLQSNKHRGKLLSIINPAVSGEVVGETTHVMETFNQLHSRLITNGILANLETRIKDNKTPKKLPSLIAKTILQIPFFKSASKHPKGLSSKIYSGVLGSEAVIKQQAYKDEVIAVHRRPRRLIYIAA